MKQEAAETIGLQALAWLAGNDEIFPVFLGSSGADATEVRGRAEDPAFLAAVLDFICLNDAWVTGFCDSAGLGYDMPMRARFSLPGGEEMSWT